MYQVKAYERNSNNRMIKSYDCKFKSVQAASEVAQEVARRLSDVMGTSYSVVIDEEGDTISEYQTYDAEANPNLRDFNAKEFLESRGIIDG